MRIGFSPVFLVLLGAVAVSAAPGAARYQVDRSHSYLVAITGKSGLLRFASHEHAILAADWQVEASVDPSDWQRSSVTITIPASSLVVDSPEARRTAGLGAGPGAGDIPKIQDRMLGPEVLDAGRYPDLRFTSTSVEATGNSELRLTGEFRMHGRSHEVRAPLRYTRSANGELRISGEFTVKQTDFGIEPVSVGLGTVKVKNEVRIRFQVSLKPAASSHQLP